MKLKLKAFPKLATPSNQPSIVPGTTIVWDGRKWEAIEQQTMGWVWKIVQGRGMGSHHQENRKIFYWDHPIYDQERFSPLPSNKKPNKIKRVTQDRVVNLPKEHQSPEAAYEYALKTQRAYPEGEHFIAQSARWSYHYAFSILKKRFIKGEKALMEAEDPYYATMYSIRVLKHRWYEMEPKIALNKMSRDIYVKEFNLGFDPVRNVFIS